MSTWTIKQRDDGRCDVSDAGGYVLALNMAPADAKRLVEAWETVKPYVDPHISAACSSAVVLIERLQLRFGA